MSRKVPYRHWERDEEKEKFWRKTIAEWMKSGLSVRAFCRKNNVPESSFNAWRRELSIRDREKQIDGQPTASVDTVAPPAVLKDSRGRVIPARFHEARLQPASSPPSSEPVQFVPLQLVSEQQEGETKKCGAGAVEILSPSGITLRVNNDVDFAFLSQLLRSLEANRC